MWSAHPSGPATHRNAAGARSLQEAGKLPRARFLYFFVHARVGRRDQFGHDIIMLRDRIVGIAARPKEVRRRDLVAPRQWHGHHVKTVAVAGQIHHFQFGGGEHPRKPFLRANTTESTSFWVCSIGPMSRSRLSACTPNPFAVFARISCWFQASGTLRVNAIIPRNTSILTSSAPRGAAGMAAANSKCLMNSPPFLARISTELVANS